MISEVVSQVMESNEAVSAANKEKKTDSSQYGRTVGAPRLSEKAEKYYNELKKKYSNMDFVLVSKDMKEQAKANAAAYANPVKMVVLIDEEKIERMAVDENYRKQYESIISGSASQLSSLKEGLGEQASAVKGFGMEVKDNGTASYFAVIDKSLAAQKDRIEKAAEKKKAEKKEAQKEQQKERLEEQRTKKKEDGSQIELEKGGDYITVRANSIEELLQKIKDAVYYGMSDYVRTDSEKMVGQNIDFFG